MGLIVQKFGGTSVADAERIHKAANRAIAVKNQGHQVVVVVSAMGHTTDELINLASQVCRVDGQDILPQNAKWISSWSPANRSPSPSWPWPSTPRATRPSASPAGRSA